MYNTENSDSRKHAKPKICRMLAFGMCLHLIYRQNCLALFYLKPTLQKTIADRLVSIGARQALWCRLDKGISKIVNKKDIAAVATKF